jgi:hypothetical protein
MPFKDNSKYLRSFFTLLFPTALIAVLEEADEVIEVAEVPVISTKIVPHEESVSQYINLPEAQFRKNLKSRKQLIFNGHAFNVCSRNSTDTHWRCAQLVSLHSEFALEKVKSFLSLFAEDEMSGPSDNNQNRAWARVCGKSGSTARSQPPV